MRVLVTGGSGFVGRHVVRRLAIDHEVITVQRRVRFPSPSPVRDVELDLAELTADGLAGAVGGTLDVVIHLAELSNDPLGQNRPEITYKINHEGSLHLANAARDAGVRRFVYASSCSVYGVGSGNFLDESSPVNPQTAYADCKVRVERDVSLLASDRFSVVFLRNATAYGPSPRMRFDIVLNDLCALARTRKKIAMVSDGSPWRPIVHIEDICEAMRCAAEAPASAINREIFNVGQTSENYRVREIAQIVAEAFPGCEVSAGPPSQDNRSYRVRFDKIASRLPGFKARWTAAQGADELRRLFERIELSQETYEYRAFTRLKQLKYLLRTGQIDEDLFWRPQ